MLELSSGFTLAALGIIVQGITICLKWLRFHLKWVLNGTDIRDMGHKASDLSHSDVIDLGCKLQVSWSYTAKFCICDMFHQFFTGVKSEFYSIQTQFKL